MVVGSSKLSLESFYPVKLKILKHPNQLVSNRTIHSQIKVGEYEHVTNSCYLTQTTKKRPTDVKIEYNTRRKDTPVELDLLMVESARRPEEKGPG